MIAEEKYSELSEHIGSVLPLLNEKQKRIFLASEAISLGYGGVKIIPSVPYYSFARTVSVRAL
jgi:hypothetical protein